MFGKVLNPLAPPAAPFFLVCNPFPFGLQFVRVPANENEDLETTRAEAITQ
jgi:hypothetical protein